MERSWMPIPANMMYVPVSGLCGGTLDPALAARPPPVPWIAMEMRSKEENTMR